VKAVGHNTKFGDGPLKSKNSEQTWGTEYGQSVKRMIPEVAIGRQQAEWFHERLNFLCWVFLP